MSCICLYQVSKQKIMFLGFGTRKSFGRCGVKSGLIQKRLMFGKKYFTWLYILRYPFISVPTHFWPQWVFSFLNWYAFLLLNQKTSKSNFCVKLLSCKRNFVSQNFFEPLLQELHQNWVPRYQFFEWLKLGGTFFLISVDILQTNILT